MNSGIYALYWWEQDLVYIGLSQNLSSRCNEHFRDMKNNNHTNYKVQNAFNLYGEPEFIILEICSILNLPEKEVLWCNEFDALGKNGLCLVEPGIVGFGTSANNSKYLKLQILLAFRKLYLTDLGHTEILNIVKVPKTLLFDIYSGRSHTWLQEKYPKQYTKMCLKSRKTYLYHNNSLDKIISPTGNIFVVSNRLDFARKHGLEPLHLRALLLGARKLHKGWVKWQGC